jgi:uncharacterized membrane protein YdjX (TVP38/TMEM64 family)
MNAFTQWLLRWLAESEQFFHQLGWGGVLVYALVIAVAGLVSAPLSPLAIGAGVLFGLGRGIVAIELGTALSAALNFIISRYVARGFVHRRVMRDQRFRLIDEAIGREGWKIIALLRFVPMPFGFANYLYGLTAIPFGPYLLATFVAIIPANVSLTWLGATANVGLAAATGSSPTHPLKFVFLGLGLCAAIAALMYVSKVARLALAERTAHLPETQNANGGPQ